MIPKTPSLRVVQAAPGTGGAAAEPTDAEVLRLIQQGGRDGAAALYDHVGAQVDATVWRLLGADHDHDDVVHDILCTMLEKASQVRDPSRLRGWVRRVAVSRVINELRRRRIRRFWSPLEGSPDRFTDDYGRVGHDAPTAAVYSILQRLPPKERVAVSLRYFEQYTIDEIATAMGCSRRTVNRKLAEGSERFRRMASRHPALEDWVHRTSQPVMGEGL